MNKNTTKTILGYVSLFSIGLAFSLPVGADQNPSRLTAIEKRIKAEEKYMQDNQDSQTSRSYRDHAKALEFWQGQRAKIMAQKHLADEEARLSRPAAPQPSREVSPEQARAILAQEEQRLTFSDVSKMDARPFYHNPRVDELEAINKQRRVEIAERAKKIEALKAKIKEDKERAAREKLEFERFMQSHSGDQARIASTIQEAERIQKEVLANLAAVTKASDEIKQSIERNKKLEAEKQATTTAGTSPATTAHSAE